jgi:dihydroflavonol-4-reductase
VWNVNYEGTRRVLDACIERNVAKLVFVGSASSYQFGTLGAPGNESGPYPEHYRGIAYMESKSRAMHLVKQYAFERGLQATIVCPTFLIGPHDSRPSSGELIRQFVKRRMRVTSPGGRNFVYAGDAARAMVAALDRGRTGESYILGGENLTYLSFFTKVAKAVGIEPPRFVAPKPVILLAGAAGSIYERLSGRKALLNWSMARLSLVGTYYSPARAIAELGMAQTPIEQGIAEAIESLKEYGHIEPA